MKKLNQIFSLATVLGLSFLIWSCNQDAAPSLYQFESKSGTPAITSIVPANEALAGVTEVVINGSNFSAAKEQNLVFFGTAQGTVLKATSNSLTVLAPKLIQNNLEVKIAVQGVENFSNKVKYNLLEAVGVYFAFAKGVDDPMTVAVDKNENVFVYLKDKGIKKITTTGAISDWAPKGGESFFFDMKFGPNNAIYATRNLRLISLVEEGKPSATFVTFPTGISIVALDFDQNKVIWASGGGGNLYSVTMDKVVTAFPIDYTVSAVRVYNGYLYVAGKNSSEEAVYRYKINSNTSLGAKEKYFDLGAKFGLGKVNVASMECTEDGNLVLGTDLTDPLQVISGGNISSLYPGLINTSAKSMSWGTKKNLFYIREYTESGTGGVISIFHQVVRVDMQKLSAPYFGR